MDKTIRPSTFRRLGAFMIDMIMLVLVGLLSGYFLEDFYVSLGSYGTLFGSTIVVLYFAVFQSRIGKGQTIGKKLMGIKVTDVNGQYLSFGKSLLRSSILFYPVMNAEVFTEGIMMIVILMLVILSVFASMYLILVNKSRRSLHDILASSIVTNEKVREFQLDEANDRSVKKLIPVGVIAAVLFGVGAYHVFASDDFGQLLAAKAKIEDLPGVINVNKITSGTTTNMNTGGPSETYTALEVTVRLDDNVDDENVNARYFKDLREIIKTEIPGSENLDKISMSLYYGYNIGIANKTKTVTQTIEN